MSTVLSRNLDGAVALVTGAGGGIGRAICAALTDAGASVVGTDIAPQPDGLSMAAWLRHDVSSPDDWTRIVEDVRRRFGRLDCLINNAGIIIIESLADITLEQWRKVFSVNLDGAFLGMQACLPLLRESGQHRAGGSSIVNVSSIGGLRGTAFVASYSASKAALTLLGKSAAKEFGRLSYPIRVNTLHPGGAIDTPMMDSSYARLVERGLAASVEEAKRASEIHNPLRRGGRPEEIAGGVVFLCSPAASFMTGADLVIDGGVTA